MRHKKREVGPFSTQKPICSETALCMDVKMINKPRPAPAGLTAYKLKFVDYLLIR